jgi:predicted permease
MIPPLLLLYRLLLFASPRSVRRSCGAEMEAVFVQCLRAEWARRGAAGRAMAVARGFADLVFFIVRTHLERRTPATGRQQKRRPLVITRDIRQTVRLVRSQPALSAAIVLMFALGIGATLAIFSVVYGVLLRALPFPEPDRLVQVYGSRPDRGWATVSLTEANFWDTRDRNRTFEELGALHSATFTLTGFEFPERVTGSRVSTGFFRALGVRPVAGRLFEPGEDEPGRGEGLALLSHVLWTRRFGSDPTIVGRAITLDGRSYSVVGVLPPGSPWLNAAEVFIPLLRRPSADRSSFEYAAIGRLKPGVTLDAALLDLQRVARELEAQYPDTNTGLGAAMNPSRTWIATDDLRRTLWILLGAVVLLLLIACVNVTNLLLARASARERDSAVQTALGASRVDLIRERLTESLFYSTSGTLLGLVLARWMLESLKALDPGGIPRLDEVGLNPWVVAFAAGLTLLVGLSTGLVPALRSPIADLVRALRSGQRGAMGDRTQRRVLAVFVAAEVALSLILLVAAGLLVRSLMSVLAVDRGFQVENRMLLTVNVPGSYAPTRIRQVNADLLARIEQLPGVLSAATVSGRPLSRGSTGMGIGAADRPDVAGSEVPWATWRIVTKDYFKAMGLPLLAGRTFNEQDEIGRPWRAIVSRRVADMLWPGQDPIGRTAILWKGQSNLRGEVIGVVGNMRERGLEADPTLAIYFPSNGAASASMQIVLHTRSRPQDIVPEVRALVNGVDPSLPISNVRTLEELVTASVATRRLTMMLLVIFAGLALALALAGIYGVLSYSVTRRTSEIGVRLALGAEHPRVLRLVIGQGMRPVVIGALVGLGAMILLSKLMTNLLFGIQPYDPLTYGSVLAAIVTIAALACYIPARRVLRVEPATALRVE